MTYANLIDDGAIQGTIHATKEEAVVSAKASAMRVGAPVRVVGYGAAGEVTSITHVSRTGQIE